METKGSVRLNFIWKLRLRLYAEGNKICKGREGNKFKAEGNKLYAEGRKLCAEGDWLWAEAILEAYGNIKMEWKNWSEKFQSYECHLENGEVYGFEVTSGR